MAQLALHAEPIALSAETVDKLLHHGSGDAALLYLYLLRTGGAYSAAAAQKTLGWNAARVLSAFNHLTELGLAEDDTPPERRNAPTADTCPNYSTEDINSELASDKSEFRALLEEIEHLLGKKLSITELRILLELYDHVAMPPEVLLLLTARQIEETEAKYGPGRRPRLSEIKATAYSWKKNGIDTLDAAETYIRKQDYFKSKEGELMRAVGITNRAPVSGERRFLHQWTEWGFGPEAVNMAYERTVLRAGEMRWPYCNGILRKWNDKGAHTVEEIKAVERPHRDGQPHPQRPAPKGGMQTPTPADPAAIRRNAEWMKKMLEGE